MYGGFTSSFPTSSFPRLVLVSPTTFRFSPEICEIVSDEPVCFSPTTFVSHLRFTKSSPTSLFVSPQPSFVSHRRFTKSSPTTLFVSPQPSFVSSPETYEIVSDDLVCFSSTVFCFSPEIYEIVSDDLFVSHHLVYSIPTSAQTSTLYLFFLHFTPRLGVSLRTLFFIATSRPCFSNSPSTRAEDPLYFMPFFRCRSFVAPLFLPTNVALSSQRMQRMLNALPFAFPTYSLLCSKGPTPLGLGQNEAELSSHTNGQRYVQHGRCLHRTQLAGVGSVLLLLYASSPFFPFISPPYLLLSIRSYAYLILV